MSHQGLGIPARQVTGRDVKYDYKQKRSDITSLPGSSLMCLSAADNIKSKTVTSLETKSQLEPCDAENCGVMFKESIAS